MDVGGAAVQGLGGGLLHQGAADVHDGRRLDALVLRHGLRRPTREERLLSFGGAAVQRRLSGLLHGTPAGVHLAQHRDPQIVVVRGLPAGREEGADVLRGAAQGLLRGGADPRAALVHQGQDLDAVVLLGRDPQVCLQERLHRGVGTGQRLLGGVRGGSAADAPGGEPAPARRRWSRKGSRPSRGLRPPFPVMVAGTVCAAF
nr:hypothetical protein [Streptomyces canus]